MKPGARYASPTCRSRARRQREAYERARLEAVVAEVTAPPKRIHREPSRGNRIEVYLEERHRRILDEWAEVRFDGNRSAAIRHLLELAGTGPLGPIYLACDDAVAT